ncbi:MAG: gamma-glutamylcyclotransferase [Piscinibacter sp.]|nr:gamma-glutamylcyclotransferase [Piscinibacter sp.]
MLAALAAVVLAACAVSQPPATGTIAAAAPADCHPTPDVDQSQFIVGYGSLMQDESRRRTSPQAGPAQPVELRGFRRAWIARGSDIGFSTTYLGVWPDHDSHMNAVIYRVDATDIAATDRRESGYCRRAVSWSALRTLASGAERASAAAQAWIYVSGPETTAPPSARYPIAQSYVDVFLSGCLEQERRHALPGFAAECIDSTSAWSEHWVNDRPLPRRPFVFQPLAGQIDRLLATHVPRYFSRIRIE